MLPWVHSAPSSSAHTCNPSPPSPPSNTRSSRSNIDAHAHAQDLETYLLLLLSDSNLPTGGFVASSGLESYHAHAFLHNVDFPLQSSSTAAAAQRQLAPSQARLSSSTLSFTRSTLHSYARSALPFIVRAHQQVQRHCNRRVQVQLQTRRHAAAAAATTVHDSAKGPTTQPSQQPSNVDDQEQEEQQLDALMASLSWLDESYHTLLLNHVARRASKAQGIALLTLYTKAFSRPLNLTTEAFDGSRLGLGSTSHHDAQVIRIQTAAALVERLKRDIRKTAAARAEQGRQQGHLPVCWAVFAAALGLSRDRAVQLHLFLQARSLLSSSIRLNTLGPYLAHQLMRFQLRDIVTQIIDELRAGGCLDVQEQPERSGINVANEAQDEMHIESEQVQAYCIDGQYDVSQPPSPSPSSSSSPPIVTTLHSTENRSTGVADLRGGKHDLDRVADDDATQGWAWDWPEDTLDQYLTHSSQRPTDGADHRSSFWNTSNAPATTYPLGEIVQARHDQLHSRLFNS